MKLHAHIWIIGLFIVAFLAIGHYFPAGSKLKPDSHGLIHHPWYGNYPAKVEYYDGMTLKPGQSTVTHIPITHTE